MQSIVLQKIVYRFLELVLSQVSFIYIYQFFTVKSTSALIGQSKTEGTFVTKTLGQWGSICDENFKDEGAAVLCRSLGYW